MWLKIDFTDFLLAMITSPGVFQFRWHHHEEFWMSRSTKTPLDDNFCVMRKQMTLLLKFIVNNKQINKRKYLLLYLKLILSVKMIYMCLLSGTHFPLSALRLLVPPIRLVSAAVWQIIQQKVVSDYGVLVEFVSMVTDAVPELLTSCQRAQLILGLRARVSENRQLRGLKNNPNARVNFIVSGKIRWDINGNA